MALFFHGRHLLIRTIMMNKALRGLAGLAILACALMVMRLIK